jgi:hypothetical protein
VKLNRREHLLLLGVGVCSAAERTLEEKWRRIAEDADGTVGAAALHLTSGRPVSLNGDERCSLASVCKLPIAMNILALVDEGKLSLDQKIEVLSRDLVWGVSSIAPRWKTQRRFPYWRRGAGDGGAVSRMGGAGIRVDRSERQCGLDRNGVENYPPRGEWTDEKINALIAGRDCSGA